MIGMKTYGNAIKKRKAKRIVYSSIALCILIAVALTGCKSAGEDKVVGVTSGNKEEGTGSGQGDSQTAGQVYDIVLTPEEMEKDHLIATMSDMVEIDAYITPYSHYQDGVAEWDREFVMSDVPVPSYYNQDMTGDEFVLNALTFSEFMETIDALAVSLGEPYQFQWEKTKEGNLISITDSSISFTVPGSGRADGEDLSLMTERILFEGKQVLNFLDRDVAERFVKDAVSALGLLVADKYDFGTQSAEKLKYCEETADFGTFTEFPECYTFTFYQAMQGIPIKKSNVANIIAKGNMAQDSFRYDPDNEIKDYRVFDVDYGDLVKVVLFDDGFAMTIHNQYRSWIYKEARPVIDVNEVLEIIKNQLVVTQKKAKVTTIELVMSEAVGSKENEKDRIILHPYWRVLYYIDNGKYMEERMLTIDAYSGEVKWNNVR